MRISFSHLNTKDDVDALIIALSEGINKLVRINH
jgi:selenocysteine lyase/cysteine desulfurase